MVIHLFGESIQCILGSPRISYFAYSTKLLRVNINATRMADVCPGTHLPLQILAARAKIDCLNSRRIENFEHE